MPKDKPCDSPPSRLLPARGPRFFTRIVTSTWPRPIRPCPPVFGNCSKPAPKFGSAPNRPRRKANAIKVDAAKVRLLPPIPDPHKIVCVGLNYRDHAAESGCRHSQGADPVQQVCDGPDRPRRANRPAAGQPGGRLRGRTGHRRRQARPAPQSAEEAWSYVAGYTVGHDVSARDWQLKKDGKQWMVGKTFDTFAPIGPQLVTADEVPDPHNLADPPAPQRPDHAGQQHQADDLQRRPDPGVPVAGLHAGAGRPDLHRHAAGRRLRPQAAGLPEGRATWSRSRSRAWACCAIRWCRAVLALDVISASR